MYYVYNSDKYLSQKVRKFLSVYSSFYTLIGQEIDKNKDDGQVWTLEMLNSAYVIINNYYNPQEGQEIYANVLPTFN